MKRSRVNILGVAALLAAINLAWTAGAGEGRARADRPARGPDAAPATQPGTGGRGAGLMRPDRLGEELHLTQEQRQKIQALLQEQRDKMLALRNDTSLTPEQRREKVRALREEHQQKMKEILTPEQYEKWQQLRASRGPGAGPGPRPNRPADAGPGPRPNRPANR